MARRRGHAGSHGNSERWMVSYADFVTLLLAFFVVMFASSQADKAKMTQMAESFQGAFHSPPGMGPGRGGKQAAPSLSAEALRKAELDRLQKEMEKVLAEQVKNHSVTISQTREGLVISLRELGFYQSGSATLRADARPILVAIMDQLKRQPLLMRIEGHTDNVPIHGHGFDSNWELSTARATGMVRIMVEQMGFDPTLISAAGYGEHRPVADNASDEGRRKNRRVDIVVLGPAQSDGKNLPTNPANTGKGQGANGR